MSLTKDEHSMIYLLLTPLPLHSQLLQRCEIDECGAGDAGDGVVVQIPKQVWLNEHTARESAAYQGLVK